MLLVININNPNTMLGLHRNHKWIANWRVSSDRAKLADEYGMLLKSLFDFQGYKWDQISAIAIASVVPPLTSTFIEMCERFFKRSPLVVSHEINLGVKVRTDYPAEVGADRILNALATHRLHGSPAIVVDFGTATTFDAISAEGDYLGGAIAPGLGIAAEAPLYVTGIDSEKNVVYVGPKDELLSDELTATDLNWMAVDHLTEVMGGEGTAHTHSDPRGTVHQELRESGRKYRRLPERIVIIRPERDGLLVDLDEELLRDARKPRFRIPHGGSRVTIEAAEVAGAFHQWIAE